MSLQKLFMQVMRVQCELAIYQVTEVCFASQNKVCCNLRRSEANLALASAAAAAAGGGYCLLVAAMVGKSNKPIACSLEPRLPYLPSVPVTEQLVRKVMWMQGQQAG